MSLPPDPLTRVEPIARVELKPIATWKVVTGLVVVLLGAAGVGFALWLPATRGLNGADLITARLDGLKVALSIAIGGGGGFALFLGWRRQRATEADLNNRERALAHQLQVAADTKSHQERVATSTETDAEAKRITDLFTKAVEQLGSDKAPVRLGGLYALRRLGQDNPDQRQTIMDILCAYLRMAFVAPAELAREAGYPRYISQPGAIEVSQELEVRTTVQNLIATHLRAPHRIVRVRAGRESLEASSSSHWGGMNLDLRGALLINFDLSRCWITSATFDGARFLGSTKFHGFEADRNVSFQRAEFKDRVTFNAALFESSSFAQAKFNGPASFDHAKFTGWTEFRRSAFSQTATFEESDFFIPGREYLEEVPFDRVRFDAGVPDEVRLMWTLPEDEDYEPGES